MWCNFSHRFHFLIPFADIRCTFDKIFWPSQSFLHMSTMNTYNMRCILKILRINIENRINIKKYHYKKIDQIVQFAMWQCIFH